MKFLFWIKGVYLMKQFKKIIALALALVLSLSLAA